MPLITGLAAAYLGLLLIVLSVHVIKGRRKVQIANGTGGSQLLERRCNAHANFTQYVPLGLILLFLNELARMPQIWLIIFACLLVLGRSAHAYGMLIAEPKKNNLKPRIFGMFMTFGAIGMGSLGIFYVWILSLGIF